jgi:ferredoxin
MLYIDPDSCTDCQACAVECPTNAIFYDEDVPETWRDFIALNRELSAKSPSIVVKKTPLAKS